MSNFIIWWKKNFFFCFVFWFGEQASIEPTVENSVHVDMLLVKNCLHAYSFCKCRSSHSMLYAHLWQCISLVLYFCASLFPQYGSFFVLWIEIWYRWNGQILTKHHISVRITMLNLFSLQPQDVADCQSHSFRTKVFKETQVCRVCQDVIWNEGRSCKCEYILPNLFMWVLTIE